MSVATKETASGIFVASSQKPLPLMGVKVLAEIRGFSSQVTLQQRFRNAEDVPIEAVYVFPLPEASALFALTVETNGRRITGQVQEREQAFATYDDAIRGGHGAVLVDRERPNVFTVSVGNVLPGQEVTVELRWVAELERSGEAVRFVLPTTVAPRYAPLEDRLGVSPTPAEQVNPPISLDVPYGLEFTAWVSHPHGVREIACPSHQVRVKPEDGGFRVQLTSPVVAMDRDLVLLVTPQKLWEPFTRVAKGADGDRFVAATFVPPVSDLAKKEPREFLFLVDCSGSMEGHSLEHAKQALLAALDELTEADTFDILVFGSTVGSLLGASRPADELWRAKAREAVRALEANLGGTELLPALEFLLNRPLDPTRQRVAIVLTDGEISNEQAILELLRSKRERETRVFMVGVGYGPNEFLIRSLARVGLGAAELVHPNEPISPAIMRHLQRARQPLWTDLEVCWQGSDPEWQAPEELAIFAGEPITVYGCFRDGLPSSVELRATCSGEAVTWALPVVAGEAGEDPSLAILAARAAVRTWEEQLSAPRFGGSNRHDRRQEALRERILRLALRYNLASSLTSFVGVEERQEKSNERAPELRRVPTMLTYGWGGITVASTIQAPASTAAVGIGHELLLRKHDFDNLRFCKPSEEDLRRYEDDLGLVNSEPQDPPFAISQELLEWLETHNFSVDRLPAAMAQKPQLLRATIAAVEPLVTVWVLEIWITDGLSRLVCAARKLSKALLLAPALARLLAAVLLLEALERVGKESPQIAPAFAEDIRKLKEKLRVFQREIKKHLRRYGARFDDELATVRKVLEAEHISPFEVIRWHPIPLDSGPAKVY